MEWIAGAIHSRKLLSSRALTKCPWNWWRKLYVLPLGRDRPDSKMTWPSSSSIATFGPLPGSLSSHSTSKKPPSFQPRMPQSSVGSRGSVKCWWHGPPARSVQMKSCTGASPSDKEITDSELRQQNHEKEGQVQVRVNNLLVNFIVVCLYPPAACKSPGLVLRLMSATNSGFIATSCLAISVHHRPKFWFCWLTKWSKL